MENGKQTRIDMYILPKKKSWFYLSMKIWNDIFQAKNLNDNKKFIKTP